MSSPKPGERDVIATALFEPELSRHWPKRLARAMGVPTETARFWIYKRMPAARRREIALALVAECDRLQIVIIETRQRWAGVAEDETGRAVAKRSADPIGPPAGGVGGKIEG